MNESPTPNESKPPVGAAVNLYLTLLQKPLTLAVIVLALLLAAQTWSSHSQLHTLREDVARRLQKGDVSNADTGAMARLVQENNRELQTKVSALENRQVAAQSQQLALEQLYTDLSKNRDDWALAEIEQVLSTASQQLQLAGNVPGALIALQNADHSLSRSDKPQFIMIRRAIAKDIEKLKALPNVDAAGLALRLDAVIGQIDGLPLLADETPVLPATLAAPLEHNTSLWHSAPWLDQAQALWHGWTSEMWIDIRQLIRLRNVETPSALLLSPTQSYFVRENLKLRLLNARLALLSRNETVFSNDLMASQEALTNYFDTRAKSTQTAQALLKQVQSSNLSIEMPNLSDSLNAVRNYKAKP